MHVSPFDDPGRGTRARREPRGRRIGEILSILFLASLGTIATLTSAQVGAHGPADAQIAITAPPSPAAR